jgi:hypothetical protein
MYACEHVFAGFEHMLRGCWQTRRVNVKRNTLPRRKSPELPIAWREANYAVLQAHAADKSGVSEDFFDVEDEQAEVEVIVQRMTHGAN